jgi:hypothetical protein
MSDEQQAGLQVVNGEEVILAPKSSRKPRKPKANAQEKLEKKKRVHVWTDKTRAAFEKCRAARSANIEKKKQEKQESKEQEKPQESAPAESLPSGFQPV